MSAIHSLAIRPLDALELRPAGEGFGAVLRHFRLRTGLSQNALAIRVGINASYVNRLESGGRTRPTEEVAFALARGMGLTPADTDELLLAAGYAPTWLRYLGATDSTVRALADALTDDALGAGTLADLRATVETICLRFSGRVLPARRSARRLPE